MLDTIPGKKEMADLVGEPLYDIWNKLCALIDEKYDMDCLWNKGGKAWKYEYKYRRGGKTLCALYQTKQTGRITQKKFRKYMMKPRLTMTGNGSCLNQRILLYLTISFGC